MTQVLHAYTKYELMFTPHLIPTLQNLREKEWQTLVASVSDLPETHPDALAFSLMMIDLSGCLTCEMDSYRAQRGCASCAKQAIIGFKEDDTQLIGYFKEAQCQVDKKLNELPAAVRG